LSLCRLCLGQWSAAGLRLSAENEVSKIAKKNRADDPLKKIRPGRLRRCAVATGVGHISGSSVHERSWKIKEMLDRARDCKPLGEREFLIRNGETRRRRTPYTTIKTANWTRPPASRAAPACGRSLSGQTSTLFFASIRKSEPCRSLYRHSACSVVLMVYCRIELCEAGGVGCADPAGGFAAPVAASLPTAWPAATHLPAWKKLLKRIGGHSFGDLGKVVAVIEDIRPE
ncbi:hypothetical protein NQ317_019137, partial [Molorchus minor]